MISNLFTALALIAAGQADAPPAEAEETYVPNVGREGVVEWERDGDRGVYILGQDNQWYYARTRAPCRRLLSADTVGFQTQGPDLDRRGTLIVQGWRCRLSSVVRSARPGSDDS